MTDQVDERGQGGWVATVLHSRRVEGVVDEQSLSKLSTVSTPMNSILIKIEKVHI